ncbi:MAG: hypothetical protein JNL79_29585 [Myxococcales bacterium]|nr:hypothetical protein [Myxococcales bacterium]
MRRFRLILPVFVAALSCGLGLRWGLAAPKPAPKAPPAPDAAGPPTTLAHAPTITRVRVEVSPGGAAVLHEISFPAGALTTTGAGEPTLFVAFSAQLRPLAVEATKHALEGEVPSEVGTKLELIDVPNRPKTAALLLGPPVQSGHVLRLPKDSQRFVVRLRSAIATAPDQRSISILARLGVRDGAPLAVGKVEIAAILGAKVRGARATFCGVGADDRPLFVTFPGYPPSPDAGTIEPGAANRSKNDDLCLDILI